MAKRSRKQNFAMLTASTVVAAGAVLLPTSAFAAPATPHTGTETTIAATYDGHGQYDGQYDTADTSEKWVETTDAPSGITFKLPGKPEVEDISETGPDGTTTTGRMYTVETADGALIGLVVYDVPGTTANLHDVLQGFRQGFTEEGGETATVSRGEETTVNGHPALDARLSVEGSEPLLGSTCLIGDETHIVQTATLGPAADEEAVDQMHQQTLDGVSMPSSAPSSAESV